MTKAVATDQREHPRLAPTIIRVEVEYKGARRQGYLMNLSLGGAFLAVDEPPPKGAQSKLHVLLPWGVGECAIQARSAWRQRDDEDRPIGVGVKFVDVTEQTRDKLRSYLERYGELAAEITD